MVSNGLYINRLLTNMVGVVVMGFYKVNNDYINSFLEVGDNIIYVNDEEVDTILERKWK